MKQSSIPLRCLVIALFLSLLFPRMAAFAQKVQFPVGKYNFPAQMVRIGDEIFAYTNEKELYLLDADYQPVLQCKDLPAGLIFISGPELMALETNSGIIYRFKKAGDAMTYSAQKLLNQDDLNSIQPDNILKGVMDSNLLCLLVENYDSVTNKCVYTFDMNSGKLITGTIVNVSDMCSYQPGKLMFLDGSQNAIYIADPAMANKEDLINAPDAHELTGLAYDEGSGTISVMADMVVYTSRHGMPFEEGGYIQKDDDSYNMRAFMANKDTYIALDPYHRLTVCDFKSFQNAHPLRMRGFRAQEEVLSDFFTANPLTPVLFDYQMLPESLAMTILFSHGKVDILAVPTELGIYGGILDKGYALDLSGEEAVSNAVADMYPGIRDKVTKDGRIYGLPIEVKCSTIGYNTELFAELGLKVPDTWLELMDQMMVLANREDICLMDTHGMSVSDTVLQLILKAYLNAATAGIPDFQYDPAVFKSLLEKWEDLDRVIDKVGDRPAKEDQKALFLSNTSVWPNVNIGTFAGYDALPLAFLPGGREYAPASLYVLMIHPASKNREEALRFLSYYAKNLPAYNRIALCPNENTPHPAPFMVKELTEKEQIIAQLTQQLASSAGDEKARISELLDYHKNDLRSLQKSSISLTPEDIADYRGIAEKMTFGLSGAGYVAVDNDYTDHLNSFREHETSSMWFCEYFTYRWSISSLSQ